jgi:hypothetical protein
MTPAEKLLAELVADHEYGCHEAWINGPQAECHLCYGPDDEPPGAGADPYGRPDPLTHPEYWTE